MPADLLTSSQPNILHVNLGPQHPSTHGVLRVELLLDLFEELTGARMMTSFIRPGGLFADFPDEWLKRTSSFLDRLPAQARDYENLLTGNRLFKERTVGVGKLSVQDALSIGVTGPM